MKNELLRFIGFLFLLLACQSDCLLHAECDDRCLFQLLFPKASAQPIPNADSTTTLNAIGQETSNSQVLNTQAEKDVQFMDLLLIGLIGVLLFYNKKTWGHAKFNRTPDLTGT